MFSCLEQLFYAILIHCWFYQKANNCFTFSFCPIYFVTKKKNKQENKYRWYRFLSFRPEKSE